MADCVEATRLTDFKWVIQRGSTAHDVAREESFVKRIHTSSFRRVEPTDQAEVFEGNGRLEQQRYGG
ncbi:MAG: hypothetical protein C0467_08175 [Planctomycetaceae bacterium]|nr:hypothetical protein [Planctomycetaceae bacterium]